MNDFVADSERMEELEEQLAIVEARNIVLKNSNDERGELIEEALGKLQDLTVRYDKFTKQDVTKNLREQMEHHNE